MDSNKHSTPSFYEVVLKAKVAQICESVGYQAITQDCSNILLDIYRRTFHQLAKHCKEAANYNRRNDATVTDLVQAFDFVGISITELIEYIETNKLPPSFTISKDDDSKESTNKVQRNLLVDDLLDAEKNSHLEDLVDDGENKAVSENGMDDDHKPTIPLLKDTYEEIANNFIDIPSVEADKKIRLGRPILLLANTKLKISAPVQSDPVPSTSGVESNKLGKKKKNKVVGNEPMIEESPLKAIKGTKGRKKKLTKEFILPEDDINKESEKVKIKIKDEKKQKDNSKDEVRVKRRYNKKPKVAIKPLDPAIAEPPSFYPMEEDAQSVPFSMKSDKPPSSPKMTKENKAKRKKRTSDEIESGDNAVDEEPLESNTKKGRGKKKLKTAITPLDPAIAEPPSFFTLLETKPEDFAHDEIDSVPPPVPQVPVRLSTPSTPIIKQSTSKTTKKKKKSSNQFAIVTETVPDNDKEEKEWFCPACGSSEDGDWVACDSCEEWYHLLCTGLKKAPEEEETWECIKCVTKAKAQAKKPQTPILNTIKLKTPEPAVKTPTPTPTPTPTLLAPQTQQSQQVATTSQDDLCPECNLPDDGTMMIQCDDPFCAKWFHGKCVNLLEEPKEDESWFCKVCVDKQQSAFKRRRKAK